MDYEEISGILGLDREADRKAAEVLDDLLAVKEDDPYPRLERLLAGRIAYVYGAGPSLREDLKRIVERRLHKSKHVVSIAADGAGKALIERGIVPDIQVTDLDGFPESILEIDAGGAITVVHAHGGNIKRLEEIVPGLANVVGTVQVRPFGRLRNFGGFTDGDRCVYLADHFGPDHIVLAGMDYGTRAGEYSGSYDPGNKIKKLTIGKKLIEELAKKSGTAIVNMTSKGEDIKNVPRITAEQLRVLSG
ncbi:MAG: DUF115 domain-containing protein [Candidatus Altiarchaeota archaeon]|nr:DUF115 domain-containing protein [Candidatus Altiarchaeota archaeon]